MVAVTSYGLVRPTTARPGSVDYASGLDGFAPVDLSPPLVPVSLGAPTAAPRTSNLPISEVAQAVVSYRMPSFLDDYYYRIHITPQELALGNFVSTQTEPVYVWNAYLGPQTLTEIDGLEEGLILDGQPAAPVLFKALEHLQWQLSITPDGQPVLDATLRWLFSSGAEAALHITANRIVAWSFAPDWGDSITERLTFSTDIQQSESFVELRRAVLLGPRREFEAQMYVEGRERQLLDMMLFGWGARIWALPIWPDIQLLSSVVLAGAERIACSTAYLDFRIGGLAMLRGADAFTYEVVEVKAIDAGGVDLARGTQRQWPRGTRLYPARSAQLLEQPQLSRLTDRAQGAQVHFRVTEVCDWPEVMPSTQYRGWSVLTDRPDEAEDLTSSFQRLQAELDSGLSIPLLSDTAERALPMLGYRWLGLGRAQRSAWRSLIQALRGQQRALWASTFAADLTLVSTISPTGVAIDVANIGYSRFGQQKPGRRDIRIELLDGTAFHRRITASSELSAEVERLVIDESLGRQVTPGQVGRISWLSLCRGASDTVEIEHITDSEGLASSSLTFRGVRDDEF